MLADLRDFGREIWRDWVALVSSIASVLLAIAGAVSDRPGGLPSWTFWVAAATCFIACSFRVWRKQRQERDAAVERLRPMLDIRGIGPMSDGHHRIRIHNLSQGRICFRAMLVSTRPAIGYPLPVLLRPTHGEPHDEAEIPGGEDYLIDIFVDPGPPHPLMLLLMGNPPGGYPIPREERRELRICVYPVSDGAVRASRWFYIVPQPGGGVLFTPNGSGEVAG